MEAILKRLQKLEDEIKKERDINRILQLQIADMNDKYDEMNKTLQIKFDENESKINKTLHIKFDEMNKTISNLNEKNMNEILSNIIINQKNLLDSLKNSENILEEIYDKNIYLEFDFHNENPDDIEKDTFMNDLSSKIIYYKKNYIIYGRDDPLSWCGNYTNPEKIYLSYLITNKNKLLIKCKYEYMDQYDNNINKPPYVFVINIAKIPNKEYIKLFAFTIEQVILLSLRGSNGNGQQNWGYYKHGMFNNHIMSFMQSLKTFF